MVVVSWAGLLRSRSHRVAWGLVTPPALPGKSGVPAPHSADQGLAWLAGAHIPSRCWGWNGVGEGLSQTPELDKQEIAISQPTNAGACIIPLCLARVEDLTWHLGPSVRQAGLTRLFWSVCPSLVSVLEEGCWVFTYCSSLPSQVLWVKVA